MSIRDYLAIMSRQKVFACLILAACLVGAAVSWAIIPKQFTSTVTFYVSAQASSDNTAAAYQGGLLSEQRVSSYGDLIVSPRIVEGAARAAGLPFDQESTTELRKKITVASSPESVLINVDVTVQDPSIAARIATGIGQAFPPVVAELERPSTPRGTAPVEVRVVEPPAIPLYPSSLGLLPVLAIGLVVGVVAGLGLSVVRDNLDRTVRSSEALASAVRAPVLTTVGRLSDQSATSSRGTFDRAQAESYRRLRTNLKFVNVDSPPRVVEITSASSGEGKSTTVSGLAIALSAEGSNVLVIDADLRRPTVHSFFGLEEAVGLTSILSGRVDLPGARQATQYKGLDVLTSGPIPPNPSELLASRAMRAVLAQAAAQYSYVLVDTPPLLAVSDAAAVSGLCDGVLLVAKYGASTADELSQAAASLESVKANVLGVVLNFARQSISEYSAYESYSRDQTSTADVDSGTTASIKATAGPAAGRKHAPGGRRS